MKQRTAWLAVLLFLMCTAGFGQKSPVKIGDIPMEDMSMTVYDKDSSAVAVILLDYGKAYVTISNIYASLNFERHVRIKILKNEGLKWADISIPLSNGGAERITNLKASTYNLENGKIIESEISKSNVFKEKFNRYLDVQKFTFPNVKVGSILEYTYTLRSEALANFPNWQFQYEIPTRHSEYWAIVPDFFIMKQYMQGYLSVGFEQKTTANSGYSDKNFHWIMKNVPAFKAEPYMTAEDDYVSKINFALAYVNFPGQPQREIMGSWEKLVGTWMGSDGFGKTITGNNHLKKRVEEATAGITDPEKRLEAIYNYVKNSLEWDGTKDCFADNVKEIFEKKRGTAGDINLTLASMLDKAGFDVEPIMLSTRDHGFIRRYYPMERHLNYVICSVVINDKRYYLDATERYLPLGVLPERCLNGDAIAVSISQQRFRWITLEPVGKSRTSISSNIKLTASGDATGQIKISRSGYDAQRMRETHGTKGEAEYLKNLASDYSLEFVKSSMKDIADLNKPVEELHEINAPAFANAAGDVLYVSPFGEYALDENPFKVAERSYPVDFGSPFDRTMIASIEIPEGYAVDELPQSKVTMLPNNAGRLTYSASVNGNIVTVTNMVSINKAMYTQEEYPLLRELYNLIVSKSAEQIVLKKK